MGELTEEQKKRREGIPKAPESTPVVDATPVDLLGNELPTEADEDK